jgi:methylenetetrahydrofolate reductase (NADPH)
VPAAPRGARRRDRDPDPAGDRDHRDNTSCIGSTPEQLIETLPVSSAGIENVLALGGDRPPGYVPPPGAFTHANELASFIRSRFRFCLGGACYPETHQLAPSPEADLANLVRKVEAGVEFLITQLFYDSADYFAFVARARAVGISVPIVPGSCRSSGREHPAHRPLSAARIPAALDAQLRRVEHDDAQTLEVGVAWATRQCQELLDGGAPGIHFYTMNKSPATRRVFENLRAR